MSLSKEQLDQLHEELFERMLKAGWLLRYVFTKGKGWRLNWTAAGAARAITLKKIAASFSLDKDDRAPVCFDILAHGERLPDFCRSFDLNAGVAAFWRQCINELSQPRREDELIALVSAVFTWAPDLDTPIKFVE